MRSKISLPLLLMTLAALSTSASAQGVTTTPRQPESQQQNQTSTPPDQTTTPPDKQQVEPMDQTPVFKVNVVGRTTKAVNYHFRSGGTKVDLKGTDLMPNAHGTARVESHPGRIGIDVTADNLDNPQKFGTEYLTYVLWAITPEGRASNLGEFVPGSNRKISVTTGLQAFGLIVTAEPYFSVTQPSDVVVMENQVRPDTVGASEYIDARYELIGRGQYIPKRAAYEPQVIDPKIPIYLQEARNAVRIAQLAQAEQYAPESFQKATSLLQQAEDYQARKKPEQKPIATVAREAAQSAEDARVVALRRREEERIAKEKQAAADREAAANAEAHQQSERRATAEQQAAESARQREESERQRQAAQTAADQSAKAQAEAEQARATALQQQQAALAAQQQAQAAALASDQQRQQAEREKEEMRARLLQQLNTILETRDTARGLIVNMADVLFDTGKYTLRPIAREKLAKLSGIVLAYPGLRLDVEGHTDSIGSDPYNQRLSEKRAQAVETYLTQQGVPETAMSATGFGKTQPVAPNTSASGRQQNRRVELVVSGEVIGTKLGSLRTQPAAVAPPATTPPPPPQPR
ncbi:MAG: OmpA/MotB domain protein [Candidatus Angelobacter sp.]|nr:OmpA/MotB domain protein [Candidatus Angelobacter sp.]